MYLLGVGLYITPALVVDLVPALVELLDTTRSLSHLGRECQGRLSVFQVRRGA